MPALGRAEPARMPCWTRTPEAAALLASCAARPPRRRAFVYRFHETEERFVGRRVGRLRRLYRLAEPPLDTPAWRAWLACGPQTAVAAAVRSGAAARPPVPACKGETMPDLQSDPLARHARLIAALCEDLASPEYRRTGRTPKADALCAPPRRPPAAPVR